MAGPLAGVRVLDLSRVLAGPLAAQSLSDMGAEVIKIERPETGDETRSYPPFNASGSLSSYFLALNRGKRSVTVDISKPEGQAIVRELADQSDILIENFKTGSLEKMGLGYKQLSARNSGLIYCSITGFGQTGPHRTRAGYDVVIQAMGGMMSITGDSGSPPVKAGVAIVDITTGLYATSAILGALFERTTSKQGQHIDLALLDVQVAILMNHASSYLMTGEVPERHGNAHASVVPYQVFETAGGSMVVAVANDLQFKKLATILGMPELGTDPKFITNAKRVCHRDELIPLIQAALLKKTAAEWTEDLDKVSVPAGPINNVDAVFADPQIAARDMIAEFPSKDGPIRIAANPIRYSRTAIVRDLPPPELGANTAEVLQEKLGRSAEAVAALKSAGII